MVGGAALLVAIAAATIAAFVAMVRYLDLRRQKQKDALDRFGASIELLDGESMRARLAGLDLLITLRREQGVRDMVLRQIKLYLDEADGPEAVEARTALSLVENDNAIRGILDR